MKDYLSLKIANYDLVVARRYGNTEGKKKAQNRIAQLKRRLNQNSLNSKLKAFQKAFDNSKKQIECDKQLGCTFAEETRNGKESPLY